MIIYDYIESRNCAIFIGVRYNRVWLLFPKVLHEYRIQQYDQMFASVSYDVSTIWQF